MNSRKMSSGIEPGNITFGRRRTGNPRRHGTVPRIDLAAAVPRAPEAPADNDAHDRGAKAPPARRSAAARQCLEPYGPPGWQNTARDWTSPTVVLVDGGNRGVEAVAGTGEDLARFVRRSDLSGANSADA